MSIKKVFTLLELLREYFSRKHIGKLLLKLPSSFFPSSGIVVNTVQARKNLKNRRLTLYQLKNSSNEEFDPNDVYCHCLNTHYPTAEKNWQENFKTPKCLDCGNDMLSVKPPTPSKMEMSKIRKKIFEKNLFATPPLRKITAEELSSVKLRKSVNFPISPRTPFATDIAGVLKKRFVVMHSPNMLTNYYDSEDSEHSISGNSFSKLN